MDLTGYSAYYDAQTAVLGSLLIEPEKLAGQIMHVVRPEDSPTPSSGTSSPRRREIFLKRETLDAVTLVEHVGAAYSQQVREILQLTPTANNWREYVKLLKDGAMLTRIRDLGQALTEAASAEDGRRLLVEAQGMLSVRPGRRVRNYTEILADFFDVYERPDAAGLPQIRDRGVGQESQDQPRQLCRHRRGQLRRQDGVFPSARV